MKHLRKIIMTMVLASSLFVLPHMGLPYDSMSIPTAYMNPYDAEISIQGSRWVTAQDILFPATILSGNNVTVQANPITWGVADTTGYNAGWNVTLHATGNLTDSSTGYTIPSSGFRAWCSNVVTLGGANPPTCRDYTAKSALNGNPKIIWADLNNGTGVYDFDPGFDLFVPGTTIAGNYRTIVNVTMGIGP